MGWYPIQFTGLLHIQGQGIVQKYRSLGRGSYGYLGILSTNASVFPTPQNINLAMHFHSILSRNMTSSRRTREVILLYLTLSKLAYFYNYRVLS